MARDDDGAAQQPDVLAGVAQLTTDALVDDGFRIAAPPPVDAGVLLAVPAGRQVGSGVGDPAGTVLGGVEATG